MTKFESKNIIIIIDQPPSDQISYAAGAELNILSEKGSYKAAERVVNYNWRGKEKENSRFGLMKILKF